MISWIVVHINRSDSSWSGTEQKLFLAIIITVYVRAELIDWNNLITVPIIVIQLIITHNNAMNAFSVNMHLFYIFFVYIMLYSLLIVFAVYFGFEYQIIVLGYCP